MALTMHIKRLLKEEIRNGFPFCGKTKNFNGFEEYGETKRENHFNTVTWPWSNQYLTAQ